MLIKQPDDKGPHHKRLAQLEAQPGLSSDTKTRVARVRSKLETFLRGNENLHQELDAFFGPSASWAVLHDLRIELAGQVAYIEHLVLNSLLDGWVIAGGQFADGILIRDTQCAAYEGAQAIPTSDPFIECGRACRLLERLFNNARINLPVRAGTTLRPQLHSVIVVPARARLELHVTHSTERPIIGVSDLAAHFNEKIPRGLSLRALARHVSPETLRQVATEIADLHTGLHDGWSPQHLSDVGSVSRDVPR